MSSTKDLPHLESLSTRSPPGLSTLNKHEDVGQTLGHSCSPGHECHLTLQLRINNPDLETTVFHGHPSTSASVLLLPTSSSNSLHRDHVDNLSHLKFCCLVIGPSSHLQSCWPQGATSVETKCCGLEFCAPKFVHTRVWSA